MADVTCISNLGSLTQGNCLGAKNDKAQACSYNFILNNKDSNNEPTKNYITCLIQNINDQMAAIDNAYIDSEFPCYSEN